MSQPVSVTALPSPSLPCFSRTQETTRNKDKIDSFHAELTKMTKIRRRRCTSRRVKRVGFRYCYYVRPPFVLLASIIHHMRRSRRLGGRNENNGKMLQHGDTKVGNLLVIPNHPQVCTGVPALLPGLPTYCR